ncbi:bactericidal permeability-increasing protein [Fukomys damarensis]|uniref:bactericidal permeability-increasing protein n=1 Tax=Fukomys damarensis TaxID=885580 RepID=UPI00053FE50B|nr:bactericidal permeability-increasing protein [Fukomys damarensis]XP_019065494.2 bactericidal permeability-increasing protein [Fukomys damarensis]
MARAPDNAVKWTTLVVLATVGTALTVATNPGFVMKISQEGLDYACQQGMAVLQKKLENIKLPDFSGNFKIKLLGKGNYNFYSLKVLNFQLPSPRLRLQPDVGLQLSISNANMAVSGKWNAKKSFLKAGGNFVLRAEGISLFANLKLGSDPASGHITAACSSCKDYINRVTLRVSNSKWGGLIRLFQKRIDSLIQKTLQNKICKILTNTVNTNLQQYIRTLPVTSKIDKVADIDYSLVAPPEVTADSLTLKMKGEFFRQANRSSPPFDPPVMAIPPVHDRMVYLGISDYFFNTAGLAYQQAGVFKWILTNSTLPKRSKFHLTTGFLGQFLPQVSQMFPDMNVRLVFSVSSPPHLVMEPTGLAFTPHLEAQAFAVLPDSSLASLFLLGMSMNAHLAVGVNSDRLVGNLTVDTLRLKLRHSNVGSFPVELLQDAMNYIVTLVAVPKVNERLKKGFPLPVTNRIQLSNLVLRSYQNFLLLGANVRLG